MGIERKTIGEIMRERRAQKEQARHSRHDGSDTKPTDSVQLEDVPFPEPIPEPIAVLTTETKCIRTREQVLEIIKAIDAGKEPHGGDLGRYDSPESTKQTEWKKEFDKSFGIYTDKETALDGLKKEADENIDNFKIGVISREMFEARRFVIFYRTVYFKEQF